MIQSKDIKKYLQLHLTESRYEHTLGVEQICLQIGSKYGLNLEKCSLMALLHDVSKEMNNRWQKEVLFKLDRSDIIDNYSSSVWHSQTARYLIEEYFDIHDKTILSAIDNHTLSSLKMDIYGKILYVADFCEPTRDFKEANDVRELIETTEIDDLFIMTMKNISNHLGENKELNEIISHFERTKC